MRLVTVTGRGRDWKSRILKEFAAGIEDEATVVAGAASRTARGSRTGR